MKSFILLILISAGIALQSCEKADAETNLQKAENYLTAGNLELAATSCDILTDSTKTQLTPAQMCRVAILYARISELSDNLDYMASAAKCYERAVSLDSVAGTIDSYVETLDEDSQSVMHMIREISVALTSQYDYLQETDDMSDSIADDTAMDTVQTDISAPL